MITELDQRTRGVWRPSPGSVYPTLQLLEDEGLIVGESTGGRRRFSLTEAGRAEAQSAEGAISRSRRRVDLWLARPA
jgi:DNA-binding PadR family transcriptional regulator